MAGRKGGDGVSERIVAAAIYSDLGLIVSLPAPARHGTILHSGQPDGVQGFLTSTGRFVNRVEAYYIAYRENQIIGEGRPPQLFSEDVW